MPFVIRLLCMTLICLLPVLSCKTKDENQVSNQNIENKSSHSPSEAITFSKIYVIEGSISEPLNLALDSTDAETAITIGASAGIAVLGVLSIGAIAAISHGHSSPNIEAKLLAERTKPNSHESQELE